MNQPTKPIGRLTLSLGHRHLQVATGGEERAPAGGVKIPVERRRVGGGTECLIVIITQFMASI